MEIEDKIKIHKEITKLLEKKQNHLREYREFINGLIATNDSRIFYQGDCKECAEIDQKIAELQKKLSIDQAA